MTNLSIADIKDQLASKAVSKADAIAELTRRIDKRAAAGKHPMPFVVALRDELSAE